MYGSTNSQNSRFLLAIREGEEKKYLMYDYQKDNARYRSLHELFSGKPTFLCTFDSPEKVMIFLERNPQYKSEHLIIARVAIELGSSAIHFFCHYMTDSSAGH